VYAEVDEAIGYDEIVEIETAQGETLRGQVLESSEGVVAIQVFEGTSGIDQNVRPLPRRDDEDARHRICSGGSSTAPAARSMTARRSSPRSARTSSARRSTRTPGNTPEEFIETGVSAIDGMNTLVRGQKLPIFSSSGQPHSQLAMQIARQASVPEEEEGGDDEEGSEFAVIFGAMGSRPRRQTSSCRTSSEPVRWSAPSSS